MSSNPARILLIEDDVALAETTSRVLRDSGHNVVVAPTVDAALSLLATAEGESEPDLVLLDLVLDREPPALHDTLAKLRHTVVLISGVDADRMTSIAGERGWHFLAKPIEPDVLISTIARLLAQPPPSRIPPAPPVPQVAPQALPQTESWRPPPLTARPLAWSEVIDRGFDALTRRALRLAIAWWIYKLQHDNRMASDALVGLVLCALGVEAAIKLWRERKAASAASVAAAVALPVAVALLGVAAQSAPLSHAAGYLAAALVPFSGPLTRWLP